MKKIESTFINKLLAGIVGVALVCTSPLAGAAPQASGNPRTIDAGTTLYVRTTDEIEADDSDGRVFRGVVDRDVNRNNRILIPKGSDVELIVRNTSNNEIALDLDAVTVNGQTYGVQAEQSVVASERKEGIGTNDRTAKHVGGGAVLGAIIGAIAGGGKGAAIGAGAGAAAGAGVQVLTRGKSVRVPSETLLTFRLTEPLRPGRDSGYMRDGVHYHNVSANGRASSYGIATISVTPDKNVTWQGPTNGSVYVQVDNQSPRLFASTPTGSQRASWINDGHLYIFTMRDNNGREIARSQIDLRTGL
jgi:hypothetical protein